MSPITKLFIGALVVVLALLAAAGQLWHVRERQLYHTAYTANSGELTGAVVVGQTFVSESNNLSAVGVLLANYSNRHNTKPIVFELRQFPAVDRVVRSAMVNAAQVGDNQVVRFNFAPIPDSQGRTYLFTVTSPQSVPGDAITVDIDTRDPYHRGAAYLIRDKGGQDLSLDLLSAWGKPTIDVAFATYHTVTWREAVVNKTVGIARELVATWPQQQGRYRLLARVALQSALVLLAVWLLAPWRYEWLLGFGRRRVHVILLLLFLAGGIIFRLLYAASLPVTYDEGNYLYDALAWRNGVVAGGDGYVKAPLVVAWVAVWQFFLGNTVLAGRWSSIVIGVLTMYPMYFLARELWGARIGLLAAALFSFVGSSVVFDIYVHTQPLALWFAVSALAVLLMALRGTTPRLTFVITSAVPSGTGWFFLSGMLLGLGVASRKSVLALGLLPLLFIGLEGKSWKLRWQHLVSVGLGFLLVMAAFLLLAWWMYGWVGVQEAIGFNSAEDGLAAITADEAEQVRAYSLRGLTPFFRESLALIWLFAIGAGAAWEAALRVVLKRWQASLDTSFHFLTDYVLPRLGWLVGLLALLWAWGFFRQYEGAAYMFWGIPLLWAAFTVVFLVLALLPRPSQAQPPVPLSADEAEKSQQPGRVSGLQTADIATRRASVPPTWPPYVVAAAAALVWVGGLAFFYMHWIKFHANYLAEFIPPVVLLAGLGADTLFARLQTTLWLAKDYPALELSRRLAVAAVAALLFWSLFVSNYITFVFEHTGTFDQQAISRAADWAKAHIPSSDRIFTGAAVVPYVSGHRVTLDIAHPRWYAYEFTRTDIRRFNTFLPAAQTMVEAFRQAKWVLMDEQTRFSFVQEYPEIEQAIPRDFVPVKELENLSNPLTFYQRVK